MNRRLVGVWVCVLGMVSVSIGQEQPGATPMAPDEQAAMRAWQEAMTPGEHHKAMESMVGTFKATVSYRVAPGAPEQTSEGKSINTMILGGRYIQQQYAGEMMGMPFNGIGLMGYDNLTGKHTQLWIDDVSTTMMFAEGECSEDGKVYTFQGKYVAPITRQEKQYKNVTKVIDANRHEFQMYDVQPDGSEFASLTIIYTKQ
ncbi:MAG TPA: DUF1579 domain-containing protein [Tepidisphaeraceae bacterium]|nr:DUF1579 domain-containing protein [Tepidisphaeraceae bacterium]